MDVEQLKLVLDLVKDVSDAAVAVVICHYVIGFLSPLAQISLLFTGFYYIIRLVVRSLNGTLDEAERTYTRNN